MVIYALLESMVVSANLDISGSLFPLEINCRLYTFTIQWYSTLL